MSFRVQYTSWLSGFVSCQTGPPQQTVSTLRSPAAQQHLPASAMRCSGSRIQYEMALQNSPALGTYGHAGWRSTGAGTTRVPALTPQVRTRRPTDARTLGWHIERMLNTLPAAFECNCGAYLRKIAFFRSERLSGYTPLNCTGRGGVRMGHCLRRAANTDSRTPIAAIRVEHEQYGYLPRRTPVSILCYALDARATGVATSLKAGIRACWP
jgi:hypothetical protein